jgi:hypothetical protein
MADRYWVGGDGTWDATSTTNWATSSGGAGGASAPTSADNVIFDANSNTLLLAFTVTVGGTSTSPSECNDFTTGGAGGALDAVMTLLGSDSTRLDIHGSMTLPASNLTWTGTSSFVTSFKATSGTKIITTNGVNLTNTILTINGSGGTFDLGSALTITGLRVTAGTFNTQNYNISGNASIQSSGTTVRSINFGSSTITASSGSPILFTDPTNLTFNAGTSQITCTATSPTFAGDGETFYNVSFTATTTGTITMTGANTFNNLTVTGRNTTGTRQFIIGANITVSGTLTLGTTATGVRRCLVFSNNIGTQRTITCNGTLAALSDVDFRDINAAGTVATPWTGTRIGNGLGNSNITFTAAADKYWNLAAGDVWSATAWALSSGGGVSVDNFPLAQDKVIIENTGLNTSATITMNGLWWIGELDISTRSNAMTLASGTQTPRIYKNITLSSSVTMTGTGNWTMAGQGTTQILDVNTVTFTPSFIVNIPNGTFQLAENTTCSGTVTLSQGTLDLNNNTLTCNIFSSSNTNTRVIDFGTGDINITGNNAVVLNISNATNYTYLGTPIFNFTYSGSTETRIIAFGTTGGTNFENIVPNINITAGTDIISTSTSRYKNLNFTGFSGTLTNNTRTIFGNLTVSSGMTLTAGISITTFAATSGTQTITSNGKTLDFPVTFNGIGGTFQMADALTVGSTRLLSLLNGTIKFKDGTTNSVGNLAIAGTVSDQVVVQSTSPGDTYTLSATSGPVNAYFATITDCVASPITLGTQLLGNMAYSGLSFNNALSLVDVYGIYFKDDGTKMYLSDFGNDDIYQYSISKPWNSSTATYDSVSFSVSAQLSQVRGMVFKPDGTEMYIASFGSNGIYQYTLGTPWDLSTASFTGSFSTSSEMAVNVNVAFKYDGSKMYVMDFGDDVVYQYSLSTAWDVTSTSYDNVSFSVVTETINPGMLNFSLDGTKLFTVSQTSNNIFQYSLSTPWDLSTATYDSLSFYIGGQVGVPRAGFLKTDSSIFYIIGGVNDSVFQYNLGNKFNAFRGAGNIYSYGNINGGNNRGINFTPLGTQAIPFF